MDALASNDPSTVGRPVKLRGLNIAMADTVFTSYSGKRFYGDEPNEVTWRPVTSIPLRQCELDAAA